MAKAVGSTVRCVASFLLHRSSRQRQPLLFPCPHWWKALSSVGAWLWRTVLLRSAELRRAVHEGCTILWFRIPVLRRRWTEHKDSSFSAFPFPYFLSPLLCLQTCQTRRQQLFKWLPTFFLCEMSHSILYSQYNWMPSSHSEIGHTP